MIFLGQIDAKPTISYHSFQNLQGATKLFKRSKKASARQLLQNKLSFKMSESHIIPKSLKKKVVCMPCVCRSAVVGSTMMNVTCKSSGPPPLVAHHQPFPRLFFFKPLFAAFRLGSHKKCAKKC